jgi:hypothetical protein
MWGQPPPLFIEGSSILPPIGKLAAKFQGFEPNRDFSPAGRTVV